MHGAHSEHRTLGQSCLHSHAPAASPVRGFQVPSLMTVHGQGRVAVQGVALKLLGWGWALSPGRWVRGCSYCCNATPRGDITNASQRIDLYRLVIHLPPICTSGPNAFLYSVAMVTILHFSTGPEASFHSYIVGTTARLCVIVLMCTELCLVSRRWETCRVAGSAFVLRSLKHSKWPMHTSKEAAVGCSHL